MPDTIVMVRFEALPGKREPFLALVEAHARASLAEEPGCRRFDVVLPEEQPDLVLLYEAYADAQAFQAHKSTARLTRFNEQSAPLLRNKEILVGSPSPGSPPPKA